MTATHSIAKALGLLAGLALALVLLASWRVSAPAATTGAEVAFLTMPPGELTVAPAGALMRGRMLRPGGPAVSGRAKLRNIAGARLGLRVRLAPSNPDLDRLLRATLRVGGKELAAGSLGELRAWSRRTVEIRPGESKALTAKAWLAPRAGRAAAGQLVDVTVDLRATPRGGPRR
jgi:hypothetical protein